MFNILPIRFNLQITLLTIKKFTIMVTKIYDAENYRTIEIDFERESLTIVGASSSSCLSSYWVVDRFSNTPFGVYITKEGATRRCNFLNKQHNTNAFDVVYRSIFV